MEISTIVLLVVVIAVALLLFRLLIPLLVFGVVVVAGLFLWNTFGDGQFLSNIEGIANQILGFFTGIFSNF